MQNKFQKSVLIGGVAILGLTSCSWWNERQGRQTGRTASEYENDHGITHRVEHALKTAPIYKFPEVNVSTFQGTVQLSGFVATEDQKRNAQQITQTTPGVTQVMNNIAVKAPTPTGRNFQPGFQPGEQPPAPATQAPTTEVQPPPTETQPANPPPQ